MKGNSIKIGIFGCSGRMGRTLLKEVLESKNCVLSGALEHSKSEYIGVDIGKLIGQDNIGMAVSKDLESFVSQCDVIIDFTTPAATLACAQVAARLKTPHIIGTTGIAGEHLHELENLARENAFILSSNMSIGVNILLGLVEETARILDDSFDIEIVEMHHKHKVDAPSGTALSLGKAAADGREVALADVARKSREGHTGARPKGEIGFATLRGGDVIGDHSVIFAGAGERIEIAHKASNRNIYASGAVYAAKKLIDKPAGLYSMRDIL